jgi:thioredoxin-like negative regulator of GroEL
MAIPELNEQALLGRLEAKAPAEAVFVYTAFCGTCQLAERMLMIVQEAGIKVPIHKLNINYAPVLRDRWAIRSVPCLVLLRDGEPAGFEYAMKAVDYLYSRVRELEIDAHSSHP